MLLKFYKEIYESKTSHSLQLYVQRSILAQCCQLRFAMEQRQLQHALLQTGNSDFRLSLRTLKTLLPKVRPSSEVSQRRANKLKVNNEEEDEEEDMDQGKGEHDSESGGEDF